MTYGRRPLLARSLLAGAGLGAAAGTLGAGPLAGPAGAAGPGAGAGLGRLREEGPKPLPEIGFTDAEGAETGLAAFLGRGVVLNLWATWCAPCVAEMPALDRLAGVVEAEGILVLALSSDRGGRAQVEPFYRRLNLARLGIWLDPRGAATRALGARGLPTTLLIDRAGRERARLEGAAEWDGGELVAAVRRLCGDGQGA